MRESRKGRLTTEEAAPRRTGTTILGQQATASATGRPNNSTSSPAVRPKDATAEVGVTLWRLRPARANESGELLLVKEDKGKGAVSANFIPERIEAGTPLRVGDRVRLTIESPRTGYLYVVDREQYADGAMGEPVLIFPTTRTRGGDNQVRPGKLIDIPAQEDTPNYFTLILNPQRQDQVAEVLSIIITPQPLENVTVSRSPLTLSAAQLAEWEGMWSGEVEQLEMNGGAGQTWTRAEREASTTVGARTLTQEDPAPQTIYRVTAKSDKGLLVTIPLKYGR